MPRHQPEQNLKTPQEKHVITVFTDITCGYCFNSILLVTLTGAVPLTSYIGP
ncbi:hypothetical protein ACUOA8_18575 [Escherichia sp. SS-MK2]